MSGKSISHLSDLATQETNIVDTLDAILSITPEDGTMLRLLNYVSTGSAEGLPLIMDLRDSNDDPLPADTDLILRVERPTDDTPVAVSVAETNIAAWNNLTTSQQRNEENIDAVKIELQGGRVTIRDKDELTIEVDSSAQIDWSNSEVYFVREAVRQEPYGG